MRAVAPGVATGGHRSPVTGHRSRSLPDGLRPDDRRRAAPHRRAPSVASRRSTSTAATTRTRSGTRTPIASRARCSPPGCARATGWCCCCRRFPSTLFCYLGAARIGVITAGISTRYRRQEIGEILANADPRLVLTVGARRGRRVPRPDRVGARRARRASSASSASRARGPDTLAALLRGRRRGRRRSRRGRGGGRGRTTRSPSSTPAAPPARRRARCTTRRR